MSKPRHLHPVAILFNAARIIKEAIVPIIAGFFATFRNGPSIYLLLGLVAFLIILITYSVVSWYRFSYRVENDELRIEYGIFVRKKRYISKNRIQSIDLTAGVVHRLLNLAKVQIETAGSGAGAEASLKAVKFSEGERLRTELKENKEQTVIHDNDTPAPANPSEEITFKRLFFAGSTSGSVGVILAIFAFAFFKVEQFIPEHIFDSTLEWIISRSIVFILGLAMIILFLLWLFGIAGTMLKYGNFTITKNKDELFITRGLLEKKQLTIPFKRIQAIGVQESMIRQPLGYVTIFAEIAGGSLEKGEEFSTVLFPMMKATEVERFLRKFLPEYAIQSEKFEPLPKRAAKFYLLRASILFIFIVIGVAYFLPQFAWVAFILLAVSLGFGFLRYKDTGWHLDGQCLIVRYRGFSRMTMRIYHKRVQALEKRQHKVQQMQKLATMKLSIIGVGGTGKHYKIKHMDEKHVDRLADWYSYHE